MTLYPYITAHSKTRYLIVLVSDRQCVISDKELGYLIQICNILLCENFRTLSTDTEINQVATDIMLNQDSF